MAHDTAYFGAAGRNFWREDALLRARVEPRLPKQGRAEALASLDAAGALAGGTLADLIERSHKDETLPRLTRYDRWGARVDRIDYSPGQVSARRLAMGLGILPPTPLIERMAKTILLNYNGEGGMTCPLAMTDGLIQVLEAHGSAEQRARWLPLALDASVDTPLTGGQFITERHGGSTVSENECMAAPAPDGTWRLMGLKWFCSNPGELWVTTAKPAGSDAIALFLMPRLRSDGSLNDAHILRLKDLTGTRGKATAEVEYRGAYAELIGRPSRGLALLMGIVLKTSRIHVASASLGFMGRALLEARLYAQARIIRGAPAADLPPVKAELAAMEDERARAMTALFKMLDAVEAGDPAEDVLVPLLKIELSKLASQHVRRARLILAGNGTLRDFSPLPRMAEDAFIQEVWEGTHPVLAAHVEKALRRSASRKAFFALMAPGHAKAFSESSHASPERLCDAAYAALVAA